MEQTKIDGRRTAPRLVSLPALDEAAKQFDMIFDFHCGLARVMRNKRVGFINRQGALVVPTEYEYSGTFDFKNGFAVVEKEGKRGVIDTSAHAVVPIQYKEVRIGTDNMATIEDFEGKYSICNLNSGKITSMNQYKFVSEYINGFATVSIGKYKGIIDKDLNIRHIGAYQYLFVCGKNCANVLDLEGNAYYIDMSGKRKQLRDGYRIVSEFRNGFAVFEYKWKCGLIDADFCVIVEPEYRGGEYIDNIGETEFQYIPFALKDYDFYHIFDKDSNEIFKFVYRYKSSLFSYGESTIISRSTTWNSEEYLNGKRLWFGGKYKYIGILGQGLFVVLMNGKYGVVDSDGEVVLPLEYVGCASVSYLERIFGLQKDDEWHFFEIANE